MSMTDGEKEKQNKRFLKEKKKNNRKYSIT